MGQVELCGTWFLEVAQHQLVSFNNKSSFNSKLANNNLSFFKLK